MHLIGVTKHQKHGPSLPIGAGIRKNVILTAFWPHRGVLPMRPPQPRSIHIYRKRRQYGTEAPQEDGNTHANLENDDNMGTEAPHGSNKSLKNTYPRFQYDREYVNNRILKAF